MLDDEGFIFVAAAARQVRTSSAKAQAKSKDCAKPATSTEKVKPPTSLATLMSKIGLSMDVREAIRSQKISLEQLATYGKAQLAPSFLSLRTPLLLPLLLFLALLAHPASFPALPSAFSSVFSHLARSLVAVGGARSQHGAAQRPREGD
eukprot:3598737-Rhodomonas_salina.1